MSPKAEFFSRHILPAHFVLFPFSFRCFFFFAVFFIFCTLSRKWRPALFVLTLRHLFLRSSGHSVTEIAKLSCWTSLSDISEQVFKSRWPFFFWFKCKKCYRKSCKHMRNNSTRQKGKKKFNFTASKFRAQRYEDIWPTKVGKPWIEKGDAHADMVQKDLENL